MDDLSPSWTTSLAILALTGSTVTDEGDHLVVRTPQNPTFHWGNCIVVRSHDRLGDAAHWQDRFSAAHPDATWLAVGLPRMPDDVAGWTAIGATLEENESLTSSTVPRLLPAPLPVRPVAQDADDAEAIDLDDLVALLEHPAKWFVRTQLGVWLPGEDDEVDDHLPLRLDGLATWAIGDRLLQACLAGVDRSLALGAEYRRGVLPPRTPKWPVSRNRSFSRYELSVLWRLCWIPRSTRTQAVFARANVRATRSTSASGTSARRA